MAKPPIDPLSKSIGALRHSPGAIHIKELRFPNYRNLEPNARLPFEFPITVLLGRNGSNKSSILHALYGCAPDRSLSDFWFETELDAIPATRDGLKQSVTHTYKNTDGVVGECIKSRAPRQQLDPDYWEAVKPTQKYGFPAKAKRFPPIELNIVHLDFRGELPAFDKYFYFPDSVHLARRRSYDRKHKLRRGYRKQDYLRQRSRRLRNKLQAEGTAISHDELSILRYILERDYASGTVLQHSLFRGHEGWTILFKTPALSGGYSDAFAGSGESAAALLVHKLLATPDNSLVLLDEPETSLHPRAQRRLLEFIAHYAMKKSLQIVMATHSIYLADKELPQSAIRVLEPTATGNIHISTTHSANEALHEIDTAAFGKAIIVEDERAKHIVLSALKSASTTAAIDIQVVIRDGGTSRIFRDIQAYANAARDNVFVVFDGDHRPACEVPSDAALPQGRHELNKLISKLTKGPNKNGPDLDFVDVGDQTRFIKFFRSRIHFLPGTTPERLVWDDDAAVCLLNQFKIDGLPADIHQEVDGKQQIKMLAERVCGFSDEAVFQFLVAQFLVKESDERKELEGTLRSIRDA